MDRLAFTEAIRKRWEATRAEQLTYTRVVKLKVAIALRDGGKIYASSRWSDIAHRTMLELLRERGLKRLLRRVREFVSVPELNYEFASKKWFSVLYYTLYDLYPFAQQYVAEGEAGDFFLRIAAPILSDYPRYLAVYHSTGGYPVFTERANETIYDRVQTAIDQGQTRAEQARVWLELVRLYYNVYFAIFADIHILASAKLPAGPRYRLLRSIGIDPLQRVFLAKQVDSEAQVVVKWVEGETEEILENWERIRNSGAKMLWFDTTYALLRGFKVLVMEKLDLVDYQDDALRMMLDVARQLAVVHRDIRGPYVHSDLKLDNILKRVNGDAPPDYLSIDWDNVSRKPWRGVPNAVRREAYSPLWTSQPMGLKPTSYRYDLQELFYAAVDLSRKPFTRAYRRRYPRASVPQWQADAATLISEMRERKLDVEAIRVEMQSNTLLGYDNSEDLFNAILRLPERAPVDQIDYTDVIEWLEARVEPRTNARVGQNFASETMPKCVQCERTVEDPMEVVSESDGSAVLVCGLTCAALQNSHVYHERAMARKSITAVARIPRPRCSICGKATDSACNCGESYCGRECQALDYAKHKSACNQKREEKTLARRLVTSPALVQ